MQQQKLNIHETLVYTDRAVEKIDLPNVHVLQIINLCHNTTAKLKLGVSVYVLYMYTCTYFDVGGSLIVAICFVHTSSAGRTSYPPIQTRRPSWPSTSSTVCAASWPDS